MKKNDDGYVLPFVLVVLIVMALVATTALSAALRNINTQQNFIERMQDRYMAEGAIEIVVAELTDESEMANIEGTSAAEAIKNKISSACSNVYGEGSPINDPSPQLPDEGIDQGELTYAFTLESTFDTVKITAGVILKGTINGISGGSSSFTVTNPTITYTSYEIGGAG